MSLSKNCLLQEILCLLYNIVCTKTEVFHDFKHGSRVSEDILNANAADGNRALFLKYLADSSPETADHAVFLTGDDLFAFFRRRQDDLPVEGLIVPMLITRALIPSFSSSCAARMAS